MNKNNVMYWLTTGLFAAVYLGSGTADLLHAAPVAATVKHLGFPAYLPTILGPWKLAGALTLLLPGLPRLKEWAYAGVVFELTGALSSHLITGDPAFRFIPPVVLLSLLATSYVLRPASRRVIVPEKEPRRELSPAVA